MLITDRRLIFISIIESNTSRSLSDPSLALLVYDIVQSGSTHLSKTRSNESHIKSQIEFNKLSTNIGKIRDAKHEAYRIQNIGLSRTVEACDGVELPIEAFDLRADSVRLEAFEHDRFYVHFDLR